MSFWAYLWNRVKAAAFGFGAAVQAAFLLLGLYLSGKRLEAELAQARLRIEIERAAASTGRIEMHLERAGVHAAKAALIEAQLGTIREHGAVEQKRLCAMPPAQVTEEYLKRLRVKQP
jgi:hypothetical protein